MTDYHPYQFLLVEFTLPDEVLVKCFGRWAGGFASGDSWRLNSGINSVSVDDDIVRFEGFSGSTYHCYIESYGISSPYALGWLEDRIEQVGLPARIFTEEEMLTYVKEKTDA